MPEGCRKGQTLHGTDPARDRPCTPLHAPNCAEEGTDPARPLSGLWRKWRAAGLGRRPVWMALEAERSSAKSTGLCRNWKAARLGRRFHRFCRQARRGPCFARRYAGRAASPTGRRTQSDRSLSRPQPSPARPSGRWAAGWPMPEGTDPVRPARAKRRRAREGDTPLPPAPREWRAAGLGRQRLDLGPASGLRHSSGALDLGHGRRKAALAQSTLSLKGAVGFAPLGDWGQRLRRKIKATSRFCPNR